MGDFLVGVIFVVTAPVWVPVLMIFTVACFAAVIGGSIFVITTMGRLVNKAFGR